MAGSTTDVPHTRHRPTVNNSTLLGLGCRDSALIVGRIADSEGNLCGTCYSRAPIGGLLHRCSILMNGSYSNFVVSSFIPSRGIVLLEP